MTGRNQVPLPFDKTPTPMDRALRDGRVIAGAVAALLVLTLLAGLLAWPWLRPLLSTQFGFAVCMMALILFIVINLTAACILAERKISAFIQDRKGPNRVGYWGLLQPVADGLKFLLKEDYVPPYADRPIFVLAPALAFTVALIIFPVIPWAGSITWPWSDAQGRPITVSTQVADLDVGVLYMLAIGSLSVYGVVLAGWSSNNKYAFYGGMRATAQMISYEIPLGLGLLVILLVAGTLRLDAIVEQQARTGIWNVFVHPIAFLLVLVAAFAETNRAPFDLAECEQELVAGYHTEYSAMKFGLFFLAEYAHMIFGSALIIALFCGGWHFWLLPGADNQTWWGALIKFTVYWIKILLFIGLYMVVRWTIPRFRFDQLMRLAWKGMIPLGMVVLVVQGLATAFGWRIDPRAGWGANLLAALVMLGLNLAILAAVLVLLARSRSPVTGRQENLPPVEVVPAGGAVLRSQRSEWPQPG